MDNEFKATVVYAQICSASITFVASSFIATAIIWSPGRLTSPYRRLIFGLSLSDVLQSLALIVGPFAIPASSSDLSSLLGVGNQGTCSAQGFVLDLAGHGIPMYICALSYYYYCKLTCHMSDEEFSRRIEWKVHCGIWLLGLSFSIAALATKSLNPYGSGTFCSFATFPPDCRQHPDLYDECRGAQTVLAFEMVYLANVVFFLSCILRNVSFLLWYIIKRDRKFGGGGSDNTNMPRRNLCNSFFIDQKKTTEVVEDSVPRINLRQTHEHDQQGQQDKAAESLRKTIRREMMVQSCLYVVAYFVTYSSYSVYVVMFSLGLDPPSFLLIASAITCPLGGLFNIIVFTRPAVWILKRRYSSEYSWLKALLLVVKAGGEIPENELPRNKSGNLELKIDAQNDIENSVQIGYKEPKSDMVLSGSIGGQCNSSSDSEMSKSNIAYRPRNEWDARYLYNDARMGLSNHIEELSNIEELSESSSPSLFCDDEQKPTDEIVQDDAPPSTNKQSVFTSTSWVL